MKLKIIDVSIENCLKLTHRYISMQSLWNDNNFQILKKITPDIMNQMLKIPLIIFLRDEGNFTSKASSEIKGLESLFSIFILDITYILNPELLIFYRVFLQRSQEKSLAEKQVNVILINDESVKNINFYSYQKMKLLMDLITFSKPNSSSLDVNLLEKIYGENELDFFGSTSIKNLFPRKRKASIVKEKSNIKNPWLMLYLHPNKIYLSVQEAVKPKKEIEIIHCPICALEHKVSEVPVFIEEGNLKFKCVHKGTQFAKYLPFQIPCLEFAGEMFDTLDRKNLQVFFKNNIQPVNIDNVYMIQVLKANSISTFISLKQFMQFKSSAIDFNKPNMYKNFLCPICGKNHLINFSSEHQEDYIDINQHKYMNFTKLFTEGAQRIEFNCDHDGTPYFMYKKFSLKKIESKSFRDQVILITERYYGNYMDGKKIIVQVINDKPFIIDMANFL